MTALIADDSKVMRIMLKGILKWVYRKINEYGGLKQAFLVFETGESFPVRVILYSGPGKKIREMLKGIIDTDITNNIRSKNQANNIQALRLDDSRFGRHLKKIYEYLDTLMKRSDDFIEDGASSPYMLPRKGTRHILQ